MKSGDLIQFGDEWSHELAGKIGIVTAVRINPTGLDARDLEWDCLVEGRMELNFIHPVGDWCSIRLVHERSADETR